MVYAPPDWLTVAAPVPVIEIAPPPFESVEVVPEWLSDWYTCTVGVYVNVFPARLNALPAPLASVTVPPPLLSVIVGLVVPPVLSVWKGVAGALLAIVKDGIPARHRDPGAGGDGYRLIRRCVRDDARRVHGDARAPGHEAGDARPGRAAAAV